MTIKCRLCNNNTRLVLSLPEIYPSTFISNTFEYNKLNKLPLDLVKCDSCSLVQLNDTASLDSMYTKYWYRSGLNSSMLSDLYGVVKDTLKLVSPAHEKVWVDIGCNDGSLFAFVPNKFTKVGFDPAQNLNTTGCDYFINDYFNLGKFYDLNVDNADIITSIAMFYDLPDPVDFVHKVKNILNPNGIWVIQFTDLQSMLLNTMFDNICHEHLEYYSALDIISLMERCGLDVFDIDYVNVNGGSLRFYISHIGARERDLDKLYEIVRVESAYLQSYTGSFTNFKNKIKDAKQKTLKYIGSKNNVHVLGASTKGNTLLQVFDINNTMIEYAAEVNKDKFGLMTVGSNIKIISEEDSLRMNPDCYLVLPWHFREFFLKENTPIYNYVMRGGELLFPLPIPHIIKKDFYINRGKLLEVPL